MRLASPWWLLLLALLPLLWRQAGAVAGRPAIRFPSFAAFGTAAAADRRRLVLGALRSAVVILVALAMARPQAGSAATPVHREGVDVVLAVDVSGSMLAEDFELAAGRASRLDVVKSVVKEFIAARAQDRVGLVLFGARAYTQCPLTLDHGWLRQNLDRAEVGVIEDGTAVGAGLATAVNRVRASTAKSKFVVLLTDGQQNAGRITPQTAAEAAAALGIRVYTVGAGSRGMAPFPVRDLFGNKVYRPVQVDIDEQTLQKVAETTGGRYFRATDTESLRKIYEEIDAAEKTEFEAPAYADYRELYPWLLWPALLLLGVELVLADTRFRKIP